MYRRETSWVNAGGVINIYTDTLTSSDIDEILKVGNLISIQFSVVSPTLATYSFLNESLFSKRPDVGLRLYSPEILNSTDFVKVMNQLRYLYIDEVDNKGLQKIGELQNLRGLRISGLKSVSLKPLLNLHNLEELSLDTISKDIESVSSLNSLKVLRLRSMNLENLDFISELKNLKEVEIVLGNISNLEALIDIPKLNKLVLWQIRKLSDLSFISDIENLEYLHLANMRNVKNLPGFERNIKLKYIFLQTLKGLQDVSILKKLPSLEGLLGVALSSLQPSDFQVLKECENLVMATIDFGSVKKNAEFELVQEEMGIKKFDWGEVGGQFIL